MIVSTESTALKSQCDIAGVWKHSEKEAWLNVDLEKGVIIVKSHASNPSAEGLTVIKSLAYTDQANWNGKMYDARSKNFVPVKISEGNCKELIVVMDGSDVLRLLRE